MEIGIGTAQFGLDYGVSNRDGRVSAEEVRKILVLATQHGVRYLDTAAEYGQSECVIGSTFPDAQPFRIVTKTANSISIAESFHESLRRLNQSEAYGLLVHNPDDLLSEKRAATWDALLELKNAGLVKKIGVSVYNREQLDGILEHFPLDLVQLPLNVFDQRLFVSGHLEKLKKAGIEVHVRSIFLQGLLLMMPEEVPPYFNGLRDKISDYRAFLRENKLNPLQGALRFASQLDQIDCAIIGTCSEGQLREALESLPTDARQLDFRRFALNDDPRINPVNWRV